MDKLSLRKKVLIAISGRMLEQVDSLAQKEMRTRSDLIREALREYLQKAEERTLKLASFTASSEGKSLS